MKNKNKKRERETQKKKKEKKKQRKKKKKKKTKRIIRQLMDPYKGATSTLTWSYVCCPLPESSKSHAGTLYTKPAKEVEPSKDDEEEEVVEEDEDGEAKKKTVKMDFSYVKVGRGAG